MPHICDRILREWHNIKTRKQTEIRLRVQYEVTHTLSISTSLTEASKKILRVACEMLQWDLGEIWLVDQNIEALRCKLSWYQPAESVLGYEGPAGPCLVRC